MKIKILIVVGIIIFALLSLAISSVINSPELKVIACTEEAKICPDGSAVGRSGPKCEFAECPKSSNQTNVIGTTQTTVIKPTTQNTDIVLPNFANTTKLNNRIIISGISITPVSFISDSRCPTDVQCIWAGTVEIRVKIENGNNIKETNMKLGDAVSFLNTNIEFRSVLPQSNSVVSIKPENYFFEFAVVPAKPIKTDESQKPIF